jgi:hypothetical protein
VQRARRPRGARRLDARVGDPAAQGQGQEQEVFIKKKKKKKTKEKGSWRDPVERYKMERRATPRRRRVTPAKTIPVATFGNCN